MGTLPPAVADALALLQMDLRHYLDEVDFLALKYDEWTEEDADTARTLIPDLVLIIRGLLLEHQLRPGGECRICTSSWPCPVVTLIHGLIKDPQDQYVELVLRANDAQ